MPSADRLSISTEDPGAPDAGHAVVSRESGVTLARKIVSSPVGPLTLVASETGLVAVLWDGDDPARVPLGPCRESSSHPLIREAERQLGEYFASERRAFDVPLDLRGTPFQRRVWQALREIPYGETRSYGGLARHLGLVPGASRAVGAANGKNPVSIIVPCHRVIGGSGRLVGFAGGLETKSYLLTREGVLLGI